MAKTSWGTVLLHGKRAGVLRQEPGQRYVFEYDDGYVRARGPPLSITLPVRREPHISEGGLHPYFDNLIAEGWLEAIQAKILGIDRRDRFGLLLGFGKDLIGAVSIEDPDPPPLPDLGPDADDPAIQAARTNRVSLAGFQPKLTAIAEGESFRVTRQGEPSTHIAKLPSRSFQGLIDREYVATRAAKELLVGDEVVDVQLVEPFAAWDRALVIRRFDREAGGSVRLHFEEFNQLFGQRAEEHFDGAYAGMARFLVETDGCIKVDVDRLFRRLLVCILLGNTDAHLKNFGMFHGPDGLRLTPMYDIVASALYPDHSEMALPFLDPAERPLELGQIKAKHVVELGRACDLGDRAIRLAVEDLEARLPKTRRVLEGLDEVDEVHREQLVEMIGKRWNGTFDSTGKYLSARRAGGARRKG